jgi:hypothetical protein
MVQSCYRVASKVRDRVVVRVFRQSALLKRNKAYGLFIRNMSW